jgi:hypothetical protein
MEKTVSVMTEPPKMMASRDPATVMIGMRAFGRACL